MASADLPELAAACSAAINENDLEGFLALMDEDVRFTSMIAEAEGDQFSGHDGVRRWWHSVRAAFDSVRWEYVAVDPERETGVAELRIEGILSGVEVSQTMWQAGRLRDGKALWFAFFRDENEARAALRGSASD